MSDTNFTYGETTVLADTDDIAQVTETVQSGIEQVLADTEDLNNDHSTLDAKLDTITTELSAIKKSVSDGKTLVAGAITAKGINTATDAEFATIASNIESIVTLDSAPGLEAQSYTPGTSNIVIGAGSFLKGDQTIVGDSNLVAANIAKGKSIFGVTGTYAPVTLTNIVCAYANNATSISIPPNTKFLVLAGAGNTNGISNTVFMDFINGKMYGWMYNGNKFIINGTCNTTETVVTFNWGTATVKVNSGTVSISVANAVSFYCYGA